MGDEGLAVKELAAKYGCSETTIRKRLKLGIPLDAPVLSPSESAYQQHRLRHYEEDSLSGVIRAGHPHPWHKLLARMAA